MLRTPTRRALLATAVAASAARAQPVSPAQATAEQLLPEATREGTAVWHTSIDLPVAQKMVTAFQARYPGIRIQLERSGAERVLQRIEQEYASNIKVADVVESSDVSMFIGWKKKGWLAPYVPRAVEQFWPKEQRDPDNLFATVRAQLSVIAYNTRQVKPEDAPRSFQDLLAPKWRNRIVKAHPGYSGTILTSTFATANALGWPYFEQLAKQRVMQVQSASEPPKKVAQGERSLMMDGNEYVVLYLKESGNPIEVVYPTEGSPIIEGQTAIMKDAPHPNASRLFMEFIYSQDCQQLVCDAGGMRSFHPNVTLLPGRKPMADIKLLHADPQALTANAEDVKKKYTEIFGV